MTNTNLVGKDWTGDTVTLTKVEHDALLNEQKFLTCLQIVGVDNWIGYSDAWDIYYGDLDEADL